MNNNLRRAEHYYSAGSPYEHGLNGYITTVLLIMLGILIDMRKHQLGLSTRV